MTVRATRLTNAIGDEIAESGWLTIGREYVVLAIYTSLAAPQPKVSIVLISDEGGHSYAFFDLANFEVTDGRPSGLWRVAIDDERDLSIEPESWADLPSFWGILNGDIPAVQVLGDHAPQLNAVRRFDSAIRQLHVEADMPLPDGWAASPPPE
jgi:hypothetical protein